MSVETLIGISVSQSAGIPGEVAGMIAGVIGVLIVVFIGGKILSKLGVFKNIPKEKRGIFKYIIDN